MECSICLSILIDENEITLECNHKFHEECIKKLENPTCPICRNNILDTLYKYNIPIDKYYNQWLEKLGSIHDENHEYIIENYERFFLRALKIREWMTQWSELYRDIIIDMIADTKNIFNEISYIKNKKEPGLFVYNMPLTLFYEQCYDKNLKSVVKWNTFRELKEKYMKEIEKGCLNNDNNEGVFNNMDNLCNSVKDSKTDFGLLIIFYDDTKRIIKLLEEKTPDNSDSSKSDSDFYSDSESGEINDDLEDKISEKSKEDVYNNEKNKTEMILYYHTMTTDNNKIIEKQIKSIKTNIYYSGINKNKINQINIMNTVLLGKICRCNFLNNCEINREHDWAKKYLKRLKKNIKNSNQ